MAEDTAPTQPPSGITGQAPFYSKPEALNPVDHGALGVSRSKIPYGFASGHHFVPVVASEFGAAATSYPIIFAGDERVPLAVMGLKPGANLFFNGSDIGDIYIPGYVRRYPFTVAQDETSDNMIICIDRGSELVTEDPEVKFFDGDQLSDFGKASVEFCERYERDRIATEDMVKMLKEMDLFDSRELGNTLPNGERHVIATFFAISEERMNALPMDQLERLRPALGAIYAHMVSLFNWERLLNREALQQAGANDGKPN